MAKRTNAGAMARAAKLAEAVAGGQALATQVLRQRAASRRERAAATPVRAPRRVARAAAPVIPAQTLRALALPPAAGLVVAEGDSWLDYPFNDVLSMLERRHGFDVEHVAHQGHTIEYMAFGEGQFDEFAHLLEKLLRQHRVPDAILLSGGGNDIAGDEFALLLNHALSGLPPLNDDAIRGVVDIRIRNAYAFLIGGVTEIARRYLGRPIRIVLHGYAYAVPDGRGFGGGWWLLPGPWLQPGLVQKGHGPLEANKAIIRSLIDRFNAMLRQVSALPAFDHVRYVDLRGTLSQGADYKNDWANELHPTKTGFAAVAAKIAHAI